MTSASKPPSGAALPASGGDESQAAKPLTSPQFLRTVERIAAQTWGGSWTTAPAARRRGPAPKPIPSSDFIRVSPTEKYAEMLAAGEAIPLCKCHGLPKSWTSTAKVYQGGSWRCSVRHNLYHQSEEYRSKRRIYMRKYSARISAEKFQTKIESDRLLLETIHCGDEKAQKMIALMFGDGATEHEKETAKLFLRSRRLNGTWHLLTTTPVETQSTQPEMKSALALESSRGA